MGGQIDYVKDQLRKWRGLEKLLESPAFQDMYLDLEHEDQMVVLEYIISGNLDGLRRWMKGFTKGLEGQHITVLRSLAGTKGIQYYNTLTKKQLIYKLRRFNKDDNSSHEANQILEIRRRLEIEGRIPRS